jgi:hypothetical protein
LLLYPLFIKIGWFMMNPVVQAIQQKYGISETEAKEVVAVLIAAEQKKQMGAAGMRGMKAQGSADMRLDAGDLFSIAGSLLGGGGSSQGSSSTIMNIVGDLIGGATNSPNQGGGGADLMGILGGLMGGGQQAAPTQGGAGDLMGMLGGLLGGMGQQAAPPQQGGADDLMGMLGGLLGGASGGQGGGDIMDMVNSLLGGAGQAPTSSPQSGGNQTVYQGSGNKPPQNPNNKPSTGSIGDALKPSNPKPKMGAMKKAPNDSGTKQMGDKKTKG